MENYKKYTPTDVSEIVRPTETYTKTDWTDGVTPINAVNLNKMDAAISRLTNTSDNAFVSNVVSTINSEITARKSDIDAVSSDLVSMSDDINTLEENLSSLNSDVSTNNDAFRQHISSAESDIDALKETTASHTKSISEIETIKSNITTLNTNITTTNSKVDENSADITRIDSTLSTKIDKGSIKHKTSSTSEGVTRSGTQLNIVVDAYTTSEADNKFATKTSLNTTNTNLSKLTDRVTELENSSGSGGGFGFYTATHSKSGTVHTFTFANEVISTLVPFIVSFTSSYTSGDTVKVTYNGSTVSATLKLMDGENPVTGCFVSGTANMIIFNTSSNSLFINSGVSTWAQ